MASNMKKYLKVALYLTLFLIVECRVIKIEEDAGDTNDVTVKIIIKHDKKADHSKAKHEKEHVVTGFENPKEHNSINNGYNGIDDFVNSLSGNQNSTFLDENLTSHGEPDASKSDMSKSASSDRVPDLNSRSGIQYGHCPIGYVRRGMYCLPRTS